jgi:hypothetical protein
MIRSAWSLHEKSMWKDSSTAYPWPADGTWVLRQKVYEMMQLNSAAGEPGKWKRGSTFAAIQKESTCIIQHLEDVTHSTHPPQAVVGSQIGNVWADLWVVRHWELPKMHTLCVGHRSVSYIDFFSVTAIIYVCVSTQICVKKVTWNYSSQSTNNSGKLLCHCLSDFFFSRTIFDFCT